MTSFPNAPNYTLIFTSSPCSHVQSHKRSTVFFRQEDSANTTAAISAGLFQHYQFFTPAIYMGFGTLQSVAHWQLVDWWLPLCWYQFFWSRLQLWVPWRFHRSKFPRHKVQRRRSNRATRLPSRSICNSSSSPNGLRPIPIKRPGQSMCCEKNPCNWNAMHFMSPIYYISIVVVKT